MSSPALSPGVVLYEYPYEVALHGGIGDPFDPINPEPDGARCRLCDTPVGTVLTGDEDRASWVPCWVLACGPKARHVCEDCAGALREVIPEGAPLGERPEGRSDHGYARYVSQTDPCRCEVCRAAKAAYMRRRRAEAREQAQRHSDRLGRAGRPWPVGTVRHFVPGVKHGTSYAYYERGCRCYDCTAYVSREGARRDKVRTARRRSGASVKGVAS